MELAVVGESPESLVAVESLLASDQHSVTHAWVADDDSELLTRFPQLVRLSSWEELIDLEAVGGIIVAGTSESVKAAAKLLAGTGRAIILLPDAAQSSTFIHELSLVRDETTVDLYPVLPRRMQQAFRAFHQTVGQLGRLIQVRLERSVQADGLLTQSVVEDHLLQDADLLRWLCGHQTQLTALYQGNVDDGFTSATVNLTGASCCGCHVAAIDRALTFVTRDCDRVGSDGRVGGRER